MHTAPSLNCFYFSPKGFHCPFNKSKNDYTLLCRKPIFLK